MSKAREIADALQQVEDESWQCQTCAAPAEEGSTFCRCCKMYWEDTRETDAEIAERDPIDDQVGLEVLRQILSTSDYDAVNGNWPPLVKSVLADET